MFNNLTELSSDEEDHLPPAGNGYKPRPEALIRERIDFFQYLQRRTILFKISLEEGNRPKFTGGNS